jgi:putative sterol carrier protein/putative NADPH-quinone reductase
MKLKSHQILMATSFVPIVAFKVISLGGGPSLQNAKVAAVVGLVLALLQAAASRILLKRTTYLERAFVGFLFFGTVWVYAASPGAAMIFMGQFTALLYFVLFLTTLVPQVFGYDPFTYAIAKQWYPETVWNTPQFRTINLHITYAWSIVLLLATLSSFLGVGTPLYSIVVPLLLVLGLGLPFSRRYPGWYLKRTFSVRPAGTSVFPSTARELVSRMPLGFDPVAAANLEATIQFDLSGAGGGIMALLVKDGTCTYQERAMPSSTLTIRSSGETWLKIARGEIDRPKALMEGLFTVQGDMALLMRLGDIFRPPAPTGVVPNATEASIPRKEGGSAMRVLAVQGSPRPKVSNTDVLLQQFLRGAQSAGAEVETIYLKEKDIHPCIGCYTCWTKTPGVCVFKDDMPDLLEKVKRCDVMVYATPLYNFNVTALTKAYQERLLPLLDPHLVKDGKTYRHPLRFDISRKFLLISTCGFPEISHFDGLRAVFRHLERSAGSTCLGELLVPAAELMLKQESMRGRAKPILDALFQAGVEVVRDGRVSRETELEIQKPLFTPDQVAEIANIWWDSFLEDRAKGRPQDAQAPQDIRLVLRGMALLFNAHAAPQLKAVIQFDVTGEQPGHWFLVIDDGTCTFNEGRHSSPTLTIKTPSEVWLSISNKELDGREALMQGKYAVEGDINLLMRMGSLFGATGQSLTT